MEICKLRWEKKKLFFLLLFIVASVCFRLEESPFFQVEEAALISTLKLHYTSPNPEKLGFDRVPILYSVCGTIYDKLLHGAQLDYQDLEAVLPENSIRPTINIFVGCKRTCSIVDVSFDECYNLSDHGSNSQIKEEGIFEGGLKEPWKVRIGSYSLVLSLFRLERAFVVPLPWQPSSKFVNWIEEVVEANEWLFDPESGAMYMPTVPITPPKFLTFYLSEGLTKPIYESHAMSLKSQASVTETISDILRDSDQHIFRRKLASSVLLVVVISSVAQMEYISTIWRQDIDSIFSTVHQHTLVCFTKSMWRTADWIYVWWTKAREVSVLPRKFSTEDSPALLELIALAYAVSTLPVHFHHLVVLPYDRLPLRLWSELRATSLNQYVHYEKKYGITPDGQWLNSSETINVPVGTVLGSIDVGAIRSEFSPGSSHVFFDCGSNDVKIGETHKLCKSLMGKAISASSFRTALHRDDAITLIDKIWRDLEASNHSSYSVTIGTVLNALLGNTTQTCEFIYLGAVGSVLLSKQLSGSSTATFSLPISQFTNISNGIDQLHEVRVSHLFGPSLPRKIDCYNQVLMTGNLGYHQLTSWNAEMKVTGELKAIAALNLVRGAKETVNTNDGERPLIFVALVHDRNHLMSIKELFVGHASDPRWGQKVLLVPDLRMYKDTGALELLKNLLQTESVFCIPRNLSIFGAWGGASLVFKEIIGYAYAYYLWPNLSHTVVFSGTAIPTFPQQVIRSLLCPGKSYIATLSNSINQLREMLTRFEYGVFDCLGSRIGLKKFFPVPPFLFPKYSTKTEQWKVVSGEHIKQIFIDQNGPIQKEFDKFWSIYKFNDVPDEAWIGVLFSVLEDKGLISNVVHKPTTYTVWKPGAASPQKLNLNSIREEYLGTIWSGTYIVTRKVDWEDYRSVLDFLFTFNATSLKFPTCQNEESSNGI